MIGRKLVGIPLKLTSGEIFLVKREEVISKIQEMITEEMMV